MASNLAPVYLDDARVTLQGDPRPQVAKILQAGGQGASEGVVVMRLMEAAGAAGQPLGLDDVIDREKAITPVYLRLVRSEITSSSAPDSNVHVPGDIVRGTDAASPAPLEAVGAAGEQTARAGKSQRFAESQSFADPVHKGGSPRVAQGARPSRGSRHDDDGGSGIRTQETASEEGAGPLRNPKRTTTTTTSRGSLEKASEEE